MSQKATYLGHCLNLAERSPLRNRHGCIVVKGGKIIGEGFNNHTLAGGAVKSGNSGNKHESLSTTSMEHSSGRGEGTFQAYEETSGGYTNTPLTVHSEMAAIMNVLQKSTTLSSKALSCEKPPNKLPGGSKRNAPMQKQAIRDYVERFFGDDSSCTGPAQGQGM